MLTHVLFIVFVAIAVYAQNLTGFALALILLGLVGATNLLPLLDVINAVTVLTIVNALMFFYRRRVMRVERAILPAVAANLLGTCVGLALLTYLLSTSYQTLRMILGVCVVAFAILLWRTAVPFKQTSNTAWFTFAGAVSGVLGGMYATPGPPLVYIAYRQPWSIQRIQESLIFAFAAGAVLRLVVMLTTGSFSQQAVLLAAEALPVALLVTAFSANRPPPVSRDIIKNIVCLLLILSGVGMVI